MNLSLHRGGFAGQFYAIQALFWSLASVTFGAISNTARVEAALAPLDDFADAREAAYIVDIGSCRLHGGALDPARRYEPGCIVDFLTAIAVLQLHEMGSLDVDACVADVLPELRAMRARATLRQALSRSMGLADPRVPGEGPVSWQDLAARIARLQPVFGPGEVFTYAGVERDIVVAAVERITGSSLTKCLLEQVLPALGVRYDGDGERARLQVIAGIAQAVSGDESCRLGPWVRRQLVEAQVPLVRLPPSVGWDHSPVAFSCGAFLFANGLVGINGQVRQCATALRFDPTSALSYAVGVAGPAQIRDSIASAVAVALGYGKPSPPAESEATGGLVDVSLADIAGAYSGWAEGVTVLVTVQGDEIELVLRVKGGGMRALRVRVDEHSLLRSCPGYAPAWVEFFRDRAFDRPSVTIGRSSFARVS